MTKTITLHLPDLIFEKAQSIAALQKLNLHDFLLDAIVLPEINLESLAETADMANAAEREEQAFRELHPMLIEKYPGQFVAVMDGRLIDRDANQVALYQRVRQTYPERFVLIAQIQEMPDEVIVFRSPRIAYEGINIGDPHGNELIIGRDVLNQFIVTLNGLAGEVTIET